MRIGRFMFLAALVGWATAASAVDQPIAGTKLVVKNHGGRQKLVFVSKDPGFLFPSIGSSDDPGTGTPGGMLVELLSPIEVTASMIVPAGAGTPGWVAKPLATAGHAFSNDQAPAGLGPIRRVTLKNSKLLKVAGASAGLTLPGPATQLAIRITTGTLRNCAVFSGASVRNDVVGTFVGAKAPVPAIPDCSDASLGGMSPTTTTTLPPCGSASAPECGGTCLAGDSCVASGFPPFCHCVGPTTPCGDSGPTCGGTCPVGEECASFGLSAPFNTCGCLPIGSTPCGSPGFPTCGGDCPSGSECDGFFSHPLLGGGVYCGCTHPSAACTNGWAFGGAPGEGIPFGCYPVTCGTCGGSCGSGGTCSPYELIPFGFTGCICAVSDPCVDGTDGYVCAVGETCEVGPALLDRTCVP